MRKECISFFLKEENIIKLNIINFGQWLVLMGKGV